MAGRRAILWALLLIAIGVVLLLREAGVISRSVTWWPILLFGLGVWLLLERAVVGGRHGGDFVLPLVLMAVGLVFFLQQSGAVPRDVSLWPIVLIAIGTGIALSALPLGRGSGVLAAGGQRASVPLGDAGAGRLVVKHGAGRLRVGPTHDPSVLVDGSFGGGVDPRERRTGDRLEVTLERRSWAPWGPHGPGLDWDVGVSRRVPVSLEVRAGASRVDLDLSDLSVPDLRVETGASETTITMPSHGRTRALVSCGAARVRIRVPDRTPARIVARGGLMSMHVDEGRFPKTADGYRSDDFDGSPDGVELQIEGGAASVQVN
jgi:hypothetical protein